MVPGTRIAVSATYWRPDVAAYLQAAAEESAAPVVGVFAGGPGGLMKAVHLTVCGLNSWSAGGSFFELHNESMEL